MKNSIKIIILMVLIGMQAGRVNAQGNETGIYLTAADYKAGKLSYANATNLKLNGFLGGSRVSFTDQGKKVKLKKAGIYGYRVNGADYRYQGNQAYRILDTAGFTIYSRERLVPQGKGYATTIQYYYSVDGASVVNDLTVANIGKSFAGQTEFRYNLEGSFRGDADLAAYDKLSKQYKIKYLYFEQQRHAAQQHASI
ncbi:hypothetical protein [Mucilaginibacter celer]|uniref:DUF4595 domain-containing protein n=1 Tax=Mucilaginibacter celer TaxID=2305508 RepID=A0A494VT65_9SPHI|nr:hypothetical protein [Mucilaginibacter celer]AYL94545.1 hypothetical protein HYN43_004165 [Mucilaginibacter celer]